jgi:hypothetical protein
MVELRDAGLWAMSRSNRANYGTAKPVTLGVAGVSFTSVNVTRCVQFCLGAGWALGHNAPESTATELP